MMRPAAWFGAWGRAAARGRSDANPALAGIPVAVVSFMDERGLGYPRGASAYLTKPVERDRLKEALGRIDAGGSKGSRVLPHSRCR